MRTQAREKSRERARERQGDCATTITLRAVCLVSWAAGAIKAEMPTHRREVREAAAEAEME